MLCFTPLSKKLCLFLANQCMNRLVVLVNDSAITASSSWSALNTYKFEPERGRLETQVTAAGGYVYSAGWRAAKNSLDQYIQVCSQNKTTTNGTVTFGF